MMNISRYIVTGLSILFLAVIVSSESSTVIGDIVITNNNGVFYCDSMICPPEAVTCHVTKRNDQNDYSKIVRTRRCIGQNQVILMEEKITEPNQYHGTVNVNVVSGGGYGSVRELTPEEQKNLEETLKRTQEHVRDIQNRVQLETAELQNRIHEQTANLGERIQADVAKSLADLRNNFKNSFWF